MGFRLRYSSQASLDFIGVLDYYAAIDAQLARKYAEGIRSQLDTVKKYPQSGRLIPEYTRLGIDLYREVIYEELRIVYFVGIDEINVVRIFDSRRLLEVNSFLK